MESIIEQFKDRLLTIKSLEEKKKNLTTNDMEKVKRSIFFLISWNLNIGIGDYFILQQDISLKQCSYSVARLIDYSIKNFNSRDFDYDIYKVSFAFLCDNIDYLRNTFANLAYKGDGKNYPDMDIMVQMGEPCIYIHSMLQILKQDWDTLAQNINILEQKVINKKKNERFIADYEFYKAVLEKDKKKAEEAICKLLEPKQHKKRNDDYILNKLISMPALGYAKLAWLTGIEVDIDSSLVPKELLPIQPNEKYDDYYDFLKTN